MKKVFLRSYEETMDHRKPHYMSRGEWDAARSRFWDVLWFWCV